MNIISTPLLDDNKRKSLTKAIDSILVNKVENLEYYNFVPSYLQKIFNSIGLRTPKITSTIYFSGNLQVLDYRYKDMSWIVSNKNNKTLYYYNKDVFTNSPGYISIKIFENLLDEIIETNNGKIMLTETLK